MLKNKIKKLLPKRKPNTHKGDYGKVLIVAGSAGMTGAAVLAARAALRCGAGLTYLAVPRKLVNFVDCITPEVITLPFEEIKRVKADAVAIGPGLGVSAKTRKLITSLVTRLPRERSRGHATPMILDADALNIMAKDLSVLAKVKDEDKIILTPHPGEMARLTGKSISYIQKNRKKVALDFAKKYGCIVVLKGHKTVVAHSNQKVYINNTGNPGMAKAGVGDVLCGMIAAFAAQGITPFDSAMLGVYLHGLAGDIASRDKGEYGMLASDLLGKIPDAIRKSC
ncbi:MAG: NAD(P)H-hydrate dehydratase [Candidatus Saganbacteria bacterium]|nr:NAD(P)H-hydrate dehydratase [Candidatus Saganbacteria bacterium]